MMTSFSFSSQEVLLGLLLVALVMVGIIVVMRTYFAKRAGANLTTKYQGKKWKSPLEARNKYPDVDVFRFSPYFLRLGLIGALALTIAAFNWETFEKKQEVMDFTFDISEDVEIEVPRSDQPPPPPPPPPPPVIQEVPEGVVWEEEEIEFVDQSVDADTYIEAPELVAEVSDAPPPPPPPPPPMMEEAKEIFVVVEDMPRFPGCEDLGTKEAKKACSDQKLMEFLYANIRYPNIARENGIEGTVVAQFVVDTDGRISEVKVLRDIGGGCGDEAVRLLTTMNEMPERWIPGKQRGRNVRVMFTLPIKFKLQYN